MGKNQKEISRFISSDDFFARAEKLREKSGDFDEYAIVSLDFDNFNFVNDLFSFEVGDRALTRIYEHFSAGILVGEIVVRLHSDLFAFMIKTHEAQNLEKRLLALCDVRAALSDILPQSYNIVCSGGIVLMRDYNESLTTLMDKANFARKKAKGNHTSTFLQFDEQMGEALKWRKIVTVMVQPALKNREFEMFLQPKVAIKSGQVVGAEALVRWNSTDYGRILPDRFIPILEQNGFISQLDFFVLGEACKYQRDTINAGGTPLPISVNFSKVHIRAPQFVENVFELVSSFEISPALIEIEFTENIFLGDFHRLVNITSALKYLGFKVALDDFGSAYSSLNYLKELPLDIIKIDKGFLNSSQNSDRGRVIISKVVELIKSLQLVAVMEGVETAEQVEFLRELGCDFVQGYFFAKPMPADEYSAFLLKNSCVAAVK